MRFSGVLQFLSTAAFERLNDAPATGAGSTGPLTAGANPKARISSSATWYDGIYRPFASANYGAIASFSRPATPPASSDTVLVSTTAYDDAGRAWPSTDPRGIENRTTFDAAGRTPQTIEANSTTIADDTNRTANYTYTLSNQVTSMTAINARTGDQTTTYSYGTTLADSGVARNDLLRQTAYPDTSGMGWATLTPDQYAALTPDQYAALGADIATDVTTAAYNRLGQRTTFTDQRGTVHSYDYDKLGRLTADRVLTVGSSTDNAVLRVSTTYEVRGMTQTITSYDNAVVGSGTVLNQVKLTYNTFSQLSKEEQAQSGSVGGGTPSVQYGFADGSSNQIRPTTLTYPSGRVITYDYGTSGGPDDRLNRVTGIKDGSTVLAGYTYLGQS